MTNSELVVVNSLNKFFEDNNLKAIAYRRKQSRFTGQFCDIHVDSPESDFYLGIECKSINVNSTKKLYFSQHFHSNERNQIERISDFLDKSGRKGFLALEMREGKGKTNRLLLIPWTELIETFENSRSMDFKNFMHFEIAKKRGYYDFGMAFGR